MENTPRPKMRSRPPSLWFFLLIIVVVISPQWPKLMEAYRFGDYQGIVNVLSRAAVPLVMMTTFFVVAHIFARRQKNSLQAAEPTRVRESWVGARTKYETVRVYKIVEVAIGIFAFFMLLQVFNSARRIAEDPSLFLISMFIAGVMIFIIFGTIKSVEFLADGRILLISRVSTRTLVAGEIQNVEWRQGRKGSRYIEIETRQGRFTIPSHLEKSDELYDRLRDCIPDKGTC